MAVRVRVLSAVPRYCMCGHSEEAHQHYRAVTDCSVCGRANCPTFKEFRRVGRFRRAVMWADDHEDAMAAVCLIGALVVLFTLVALARA